MKNRYLLIPIAFGFIAIVAILLALSKNDQSSKPSTESTLAPTRQFIYKADNCMTGEGPSYLVGDAELHFSDIQDPFLLTRFQSLRHQYRISNKYPDRILQLDKQGYLMSMNPSSLETFGSCWKKIKAQLPPEQLETLLKN